MSSLIGRLHERFNFYVSNLSHGRCNSLLLKVWLACSTKINSYKFNFLRTERVIRIKADLRVSPNFVWPTTTLFIYLFVINPFTFFQTKPVRIWSVHTSGSHHLISLWLLHYALLYFKWCHQWKIKHKQTKTSELKSRISCLLVSFQRVSYAQHIQWLN